MSALLARVTIDARHTMQAVMLELLRRKEAAATAAILVAPAHDLTWFECSEPGPGFLDEVHAIELRLGGADGVCLWRMEYRHRGLRFTIESEWFGLGVEA